MRVFVTGATGFIGSSVVRELLAHGHEVLGLARSDARAEALARTGAEVLRGDLRDVETLRAAAAEADGVIHLAFIHDFSSPEVYASAAQADERAIRAMGEALAGSDRPFVVTSGFVRVPDGTVATEEHVRDRTLEHLPRVSEETALEFADRGVRVSVVRLPPTVHGEGDQAFVPMFIDWARTAGEAVYSGDGANRWPAVHRDDAAVLYRLALESAPAGSRLHAIQDAGVPIREIFELIGRRLDVPVRSIDPAEAGARFGWMAGFLQLDAPASSTITQDLLGWRPTRPGLLADLDEGHYFAGQRSGVTG
ncbi:SDR family oxidoreductase [Kibdelosporangium lantanae]